MINNMTIISKTVWQMTLRQSRYTILINIMMAWFVYLGPYTILACNAQSVNLHIALKARFFIWKMTKRSEYQVEVSKPVCKVIWQECIQKEKIRRRYQKNRYGFFLWHWVFLKFLLGNTTFPLYFLYNFTLISINSYPFCYP